MRSKSGDSKLITLSKAASIAGVSPGRLRQLVIDPVQCKELGAVREETECTPAGFVWKMPEAEAIKLRDNPAKTGRPRSGKARTGSKVDAAKR